MFVMYFFYFKWTLTIMEKIYFEALKSLNNLLISGYNNEGRTSAVWSHPKANKICNEASG